MGQDKTFLTWHNHQPLYQHAVNQLQQAGVEHVLLNGAKFEIITPQPNLTVVHDIVPDCGSLSDIHASLLQRR